MTIELHRQHGEFIYRQRQDDPTVIERRGTYRGSPWTFWKRLGSAEEARAELMRIGKDEGEGK